MELDDALVLPPPDSIEIDLPKYASTDSESSDLSEEVTEVVTEVDDDR